MHRIFASITIAALVLIGGCSVTKSDGTCPEGTRPIYVRTNTGFCVNENAK